MTTELSTISDPDGGGAGSRSPGRHRPHRHPRSHSSQGSSANSADFLEESEKWWSCDWCGDLSTEQTAAVLGIAPGTVTAYLHRSVAALRASLSDLEGEMHRG